jgi:hypothetical protein
MPATAVDQLESGLSGNKGRLVLQPALVARLCLAAVAVALCYCLQWESLRYLTSELNLRLDALAGIHLQRLSGDTVLWNGTVYYYERACIFADVWCGAIPLLWSLRRTISGNLLQLLVFTGALFGFNVFRLSLSDVLFAAGLPWDLAHNAMGGIAWFVVWVWIWKNRDW